MGTTVFANGMGISHQGSGASSTVAPDVCKTPTPIGPVPIPYINVARSADLAGGSVTVLIEGNMAAVKGCTYSCSTGDEPGTQGGVLSRTTGGPAEFLLYSFDVKIEGKNACRHGDLMTHNDKNALG